MNRTLITLLVTATATAVVGYVVKKTTEKKYATISTPKHPETVDDEEMDEAPAPTSFKEQAIAKVEEIMANGAIFVLDHERQFKALGVLLSSVSAVFEIALAIWGYKIMKKPKQLTGEDLELIEDHDRTVVNNFLTKLASKDRSSFTNRQLGKRVVCTVEPLEV